MPTANYSFLASFNADPPRDSIIHIKRGNAGGKMSFSKGDENGTGTACLIQTSRNVFRNSAEE